MARGVPSEVIRHFQRIPLFRSVSNRGIRAIVAAATELDLAAGRELVRQGDHGREMFVILRGTADVIRGRRKISELTPGDFFGEMSFLSPAPRSATVKARTDMRVMVLASREMDVIVEKEPAVARRLLETMAKRVRASEQSVTN